MSSSRLPILSLDDAIAMQFRLVDAIVATFRPDQLLDGAGLGLHDSGSPLFTRQVEAAIARFFGAEAALLVQGAGTGAMREALATALPSGGRVLVHSAGAYHTTQATLDMMGAVMVPADFNDLGAVARAAGAVDAAIVQHTHQLPGDGYDAGRVIATMRSAGIDLPIVVDDNYAVMKVLAIGCQLGADLSTFSAFKLLGPEGVGCIVGRARLVERTRHRNPSGGNVVQGPTARAVLEGLVQAPVLLAVQDRVAREVAERLTALPGVAEATAANLAETIVLVRLRQRVAADVIRNAARLGAADRPVGAESRHELVPLVYRVSKAILRTIPDAAATMIRINPMRAGADTVVGIISEAIEMASDGRS